MPLPGAQQKIVTDFLGPWQRLDVESVPDDHALASVNMQYIRGSVQTRYGHSLAVNTTLSSVSSLYNWIALISGSPKNYLVYTSDLLTNTTLYIYDLDAGAVVASFSTIASLPTGATYANAGSKLYIGFYDSNGIGVQNAKVVNDTSSADNLFAAPLGFGPTVTFPAAGVITPGAHRFGYVMNTRSGYTTNLCPYISGVFVPTLAISDSVNKNCQMVISGGSYPAEAVSVQAVMTPTTNLNDYRLVPGTLTAVTPGVANTTITFSISDADLLASGSSVTTKYTTQLSQDSSGNPPFRPSVIIPYGTRMAYVTVDGSGYPVTYFSEPGKFQSLTADQHGVYLPGNLRAVTGFQLRGVFYHLGPHWTYSSIDSGDVPVLWPSGPQLVDSQIGTLSPHGCDVSTSQGFAWVADVSGLYLFLGGQYPSIPISYYNDTDWRRINWAVPAALFVKDDSANKRVLVVAPLDSATVANYILVFDYTDGIDPASVKYSRWNIGTSQLECIASVQNATTKRIEPWYGTQGFILRQNDGSEPVGSAPFLYRDNGQQLTWNYETAIFPGVGSSTQLSYAHGAHLRATGNKSLTGTFYSIDHAASFTPGSAPALSSAPGKEYFLGADALPAEGCSLSLSDGAQLDSWVRLSVLKWYYTIGPSIR